MGLWEIPFTKVNQVYSSYTGRTVQGKAALSVLSLWLCLGYTNLGEDPGHGVSPLVGLSLGHPHHVTAVGGELTAQEQIHEVDLPQHVQKVQQLAEEESVRQESKN